MRLLGELDLTLLVLIVILLGHLLFEEANSSTIALGILFQCFNLRVFLVDLLFRFGCQEIHSLVDLLYLDCERRLSFLEVCYFGLQVLLIFLHFVFLGLTFLQLDIQTRNGVFKIFEDFLLHIKVFRYA